LILASRADHAEEGDDPLAVERTVVDFAEEVVADDVVGAGEGQILILLAAADGEAREEPGAKILVHADLTRADLDVADAGAGAEVAGGPELGVLAHAVEDIIGRW
jgi:hypothetical protein